MKRRLVLHLVPYLVLFALPDLLSAQVTTMTNPTTGKPDYVGFPASANKTPTGYWNFSGARWRPPEATFASPPVAPSVGQMWEFTDASSAGVCSGGGSALALCAYNGSGWSAIGNTVLPGTAPSAGQVPFGNAGGTAYAPQTVSGDCTAASTGAVTCTKLNNVAVATAATASTIAERNASGELIAANTVAAGKTPVDTDSAQTLYSKVLAWPYPVTASTGSTTAGLTVCMAADGTVSTCTTDVGGVSFIGVALESKSAGQIVNVAIRGIVTVLADSAMTYDHLVGLGTGTAGRSLDLAQTDSRQVISTTQVYGRVVTLPSPNSAGNTFTMTLFGPGIYGYKIPRLVLSMSFCLTLGCADITTVNAMNVGYAGDFDICKASLVTAPTTNVVLDIRDKNGASIFSTNKLAFSTGHTASQATFSAAPLAYAAGDYFYPYVTTTDTTAVGGSVQCWGTQ